MSIFQTAELVFGDPYAVTMRDLVHGEEEDRYITLGEIGPGAVLFVVHTSFADGDEEVMRLISPGPQPARREEAMKKLIKNRKRQIASIAVKKDADIDLSEMPEVLDWSGAEIGKFYRPSKQPVTMRLDTDIVGWLKSYGRGYQTRVNILLRHAMMDSFSRTRKKANRQAGTTR